MPSITLQCPYSQNELTVSPDEVLETYFFGIKLIGKDGQTLSNQVIRNFIQVATEDVEDLLSIKVLPQIVSEDKDFWLDEWTAWGYIRVAYPVKKPYDLKGYINDVVQITYPQEWLSTRKSSEETYFRNLYLVPTNGTATTNSAIFSGVTPHLGFFGNKQIPNYWRVVYCTGFSKMPKDLLNYIGKLASIDLFNIAGDMILDPGIGSQSIGIDGLSQSVSTVRSGKDSIYGARITSYSKEIEQQRVALKGRYAGFEMTSL